MRAALLQDSKVVLRALQGCRRGLAMIELALSLPILLLLTFGGLEIAQMAMTHLRVNQIAITVADNAGRVRTGIDESNIYEVFAGANLIGDAISFEDNGRIVLSSLEPNGKTGSNEGQKIGWQRCFGDLDVAPKYGGQGDGANNATLADGLGSGANKIVSAEGTAVMFVEVTYRYTPMVSGIPGWGPQNIRYESAFNVRERTNQNITNVQNLSVKSC
jgi:hypothetical protein